MASAAPVATVTQLRENRGRLLVKVEGRYIALVEHAGEFFAMDATCYHMGGPLLHADIEDLGGFGPAIVCPWHRYQISLRTGDGLYVNMARHTCSKGSRQRVHAVEARDGQIYVTVSHAESGAAEHRVESDTYAFKPPAPSGGAQQLPPGRSGDVLARAGAAGMRGLPRSAGAGCAGPSGPSVASDVAKSMSGADGRAPWARGPGPLGGSLGSGFRLPGCLASAASALPVLLGAGRSTDAEGWVSAQVLATRQVGRGVVQLSVRGALPGDAALWERGAHIMVRVGGSEQRPYTPFLLYAEGGRPARGRFELVAKAYPQGSLSPLLAALRPGGELQYRGPLSGSAGVRADTQSLVLIAGGTGITPMLQLLNPLAARALAQGTPMPAVQLLCFNRAEEDVLLRAELEQLASQHLGVSVLHCLTQPSAGWRGQSGPPGVALAKLLAKPTAHTQAFYCGPPLFNQAVRDALGAFGFTDEMVHEFS